MNTVAEESFANIRTIKAFSSEEEEMEKFEKGSHQVYLAGRKKVFLTAIYSMLQQSLLYGAMAAVIYAASSLI